MAEQILKPFSKEMKGDYVRAVETKDLGKAFTSMIPNIYKE
jgi:hypothetical protein